LEALTDAAPQTKDTEQLTEITRQRLARQITAQVKQGPTVEAIVLDAGVEDMFRRSLREISTGTGGALDPDEVRRVGVALEAAIEKRRNAGKLPLVVTGPDLRRYVRAFVERRAQGVPVLSFREVDGDTSITPVETVTGKAALAA
jgi:flagellar biosynthesis protein FlhA